MRSNIALVFLAFVICFKPVSASSSIFARQNCETLFCPDSLWKTFGAFLKDGEEGFGSTPELPTLPDSWKSPEPPPSKEPEIEL